jgi:hypothetical protein
MVERLPKKAPQRGASSSSLSLSNLFIKNQPRRITVPKAQTLEVQERRTESQRKNLPTAIP